MITSTNTDAIGPAWVAALNGVNNVTEDASGHHGKYATLGACLAVVKPVLAEHGLAVQQYNRPGADGKVVVVTRIWHTSGEWLEDEGLAMAAPSDPQKVGGAVTYARRYSLTTFFAIATTDDDGQGASDAMRQPQRAPASREEPARSNEPPSPAATVYEALGRQKGTPVAEQMKAWRSGQEAERGEASFTIEALEADPEWLDLVAGKLADLLEAAQ